MKMQPFVCRMILVALAFFIPLCCTAGLWEQATPLDGNWVWSDWLGYLAPVAGEWIYHNEHGWMYAVGDDPDSVFFYTPDLDWLWSSRAVYPFLYKYLDQGWIYYARDTANPRWFYNMAKKRWGTEADERAPAAATKRNEATHFFLEVDGFFGVKDEWSDLTVLAVGPGGLVDPAYAGTVFFSCAGSATFRINPYATFTNGIARIPKQFMPTAPGQWRLRVEQTDDPGICAERDVLVLGGGQTYYMRRDGSDVNPGTSPSNAWRSLSQAAARMTPGDVVWIGGGTYDTLLVPLTNANASPLYLSFLADRKGVHTGQGGPVLIRPVSFEGLIAASGTARVAIGGITMENDSATGPNAYGIQAWRCMDWFIHDCRFLNFNRGVELHHCGNMSLIRCSFDNGVYGVLARNCPMDIRVHESAFVNNAAACAFYDSYFAEFARNRLESNLMGFRIAGCAKATFEQNDIAGQAGTNDVGIMVAPSGTITKVFHNRIRQCGYGVKIDVCAQGSMIHNNTIVSNRYGLALSHTPDMDIRNNIMAFNRLYGIYRDSTISDPVVDDFNCSYGNPAGNWFNVVPGPNSFSTNPLVREGLHLSSRGGRWTPDGWTSDAEHSPCIDAGDPDFDYSNETWPDGGRINLGAFGNTPQASRSLVFGLTIESEYGNPDPPVCFYWYPPTNLLCSMDGSPSYFGSHRKVCLGAQVAGVDWIALSPTQAIAILTNDATLTWQWQTQCELRAYAAPGGAVAPTQQWIVIDTPVAVTATADARYHLIDWTGDVPPGHEQENPLWLTMDYPRSVTAHFAPDTGAARIFLDPPEVQASARWKLTSGPDNTWHSSGDLLAGLPVGIYTATFRAVSGWAAPADLPSFAISRDFTNVQTVAYVSTNRVSLAVVSTHGAPNPPVGSHSYAPTNYLLCTINGIRFESGGTQYVCSGATAGGADWTSLTPTSGVMVLTNSATLTWDWRTYYRVNAAAAGGGGTVYPTQEWISAGAAATLSATPSSNWHFVRWTGDAPAGQQFANPLALLMDRPRNVAANFAPDTGAARIFLDPPAVQAAAQWRLTSGPDIAWHTNGHLLADLPAGVYTATFRPVPGWAAPADLPSLAIARDATNVQTVLYVSTNRVSLTVVSSHGLPSPAAGPHSYAPTNSLPCSMDGSPIESGGTRFVCDGATAGGADWQALSPTGGVMVLTNSATLTWNWQTSYRAIAGAGVGGSVQPVEQWAAANAQVSIGATPLSNYRFDRWTGDVPAGRQFDNPLALPMDQPRTVTAHFAPNTGAARIFLDPPEVQATAQWRLTSGPDDAWHTSGHLLTDLPVGTYTATFRPAPGWTTPPDLLGLAIARDATNVQTAVYVQTNRVAMEIVTAWGNPSPAIGTNWYRSPTNVPCAMGGSPVSMGATRMVCISGILSGATGQWLSPTGVIVRLTGPAQLTWRWQTQYLLEAAAGAGGTVSPTSRWAVAGQTERVTAIPSANYSFAQWLGNVPATQQTVNPLILTMDQPRRVTAQFRADQGGARVELLPAAIRGMARWRLLSGPDMSWHESGYAISNLPVGTYQATFGYVPGWSSPSDVTDLAVSKDRVTARAVSYGTGSMSPIPGGSFQMGLYDGAGGHTVTLSPFYLDRMEVSIGDFQAFCLATGRAMPDQPWGMADTNRPVVNATWAEASAFAAWIGKRLPTEAEWEYAARGGAANARYPWGNAVDSARANYNMNVGNPTRAGAYPSTGYGLWDMAGNVWEWCSDWYSSPLTGPVTDPGGPASGTAKTIRGGSFVTGPTPLQCALRYSYGPTVRYRDIGFRCAMTPTGGP